METDLIKKQLEQLNTAASNLLRNNEKQMKLLADLAEMIKTADLERLKSIVETWPGLSDETRLLIFQSAQAHWEEKFAFINQIKNASASFNFEDLIWKLSNPAPPS